MAKWKIQLGKRRLLVVLFSSTLLLLIVFYVHGAPIGFNIGSRFVGIVPWIPCRTDVFAPGDKGGIIAYFSTRPGVVDYADGSCAYLDGERVAWFFSVKTTVPPGCKRERAGQIFPWLQASPKAKIS